MKYALREDASTICLLEDGGKLFPQFRQITVFVRNLIRPEHLGQYLYFFPYKGRNGKYYGSATRIRTSLEDKGIIPKYNYVAKIESEVEFRILPGVIHTLSKNYMPAWNMQSYLRYLSDKTSAFILFLRVYKVNQTLDLNYLKKGSKSSFQIFQLYNKKGIPTSLQVDGLKSLISKNTFDYTKEEIMHILKVDNAYITEYSDTLNGLQDLTERVKADKLLKGTYEKWERSHLQWKRKWKTDNFDKKSDRNFDMAKVDYNAIFKKTVSLYPGMKDIIQYIQNIQPARLGESEFLLNKIHDQNLVGIKARKRLFEMNIRTAVKDALSTYEKDDIDLEDAFQEASIGIWKAVLKYNSNVEGLFPSYSSMWSLRVMQRYLPYYQYNCRFPAHYIYYVSNIMNKIKKKFHNIDLNQLEPQSLFKLLKNFTDCDDKNAKRLSILLIPSLSFEVVKNNKKFKYVISDNGEQAKKINRYLVYNDSKKILSPLTSKERMIIKSRFGFDCKKELTLQQIGDELGITRERVRQIQVKALQKIVKHLYAEHLVNKQIYDKWIK